MVKFIKKTPDEIDNSRAGPRGRVSYPILKAFMETGYFISMLDLSEEKRKPQTMYALLTSYISNHELPIKAFMRGGQLHLMRLDLDEDGNKIENWKDQLDDPEAAAVDGPPITAETIKKKSGG